jgi:hypothetical protein
VEDDYSQLLLVRTKTDSEAFARKHFQCAWIAGPMRENLIAMRTSLGCLL